LPWAGLRWLLLQSRHQVGPWWYHRPGHGLSREHRLIDRRTLRWRWWNDRASRRRRRRCRLRRRRCRTRTSRKHGPRRGVMLLWLWRWRRHSRCRGGRSRRLRGQRLPRSGDDLSRTGKRHWLRRNSDGARRGRRSNRRSGRESRQRRVFPRSRCWRRRHRSSQRWPDWHRWPWCEPFLQLHGYRVRLGRRRRLRNRFHRRHYLRDVRGIFRCGLGFLSRVVLCNV
jgi:hypothetical protein